MLRTQPHNSSLKSKTPLLCAKKWCVLSVGGQCYRGEKREGGEKEAALILWCLEEEELSCLCVFISNSYDTHWLILTKYH